MSSDNENLFCYLSVEGTMLGGSTIPELPFFYSSTTTEIVDSDGDGVPDNVDPNPNLFIDTDGDTLSDDYEQMVSKTDIYSIDTDGDGWTDSEDIAPHNPDVPRYIMPGSHEEILGKEVTRHDVAQADNPPGVATGLAWTPFGGDILFVEGTFMPGSGELTLTGQLGEVMKESAKISLSLVRSRLAFNFPGFEFNEQDLHIHVPQGAMPKDGPSAGVALFTAIASLVMGRKIDPRMAMTGEITLRGTILPVGGIKEKMIAAHRAGITRVIVPGENKKNLKEVPEEVTTHLSFVLVETIEDVIRETLGIELPRHEIVLKEPAEADLSYSI